MPKKAYCGIGTMTKQHRRGSMKECAEQGQIRFYGLKKIDSKLVESVKKGSKKTTGPSLMSQLGTIRGKILKFKKDYKYEKDKAKKEEIKETIRKLVKESEQITKQMNKAGGKRGSKRVSKKTSRKATRKTTRKGSRK